MTTGSEYGRYRKKDFLGIINTIKLMGTKVLKGLQDCISTYGHNKTSIIGKFASVYICKGTWNAGTCFKTNILLGVISKTWIYAILFPPFLSYIRYASWDVLRGMTDADLVLKELSRSAYFQPSFSPNNPCLFIPTHVGVARWYKVCPIRKCVHNVRTLRTYNVRMFIFYHHPSPYIYWLVLIQLHTNVGYDNISSEFYVPGFGLNVKVTVAFFRKKILSSL